MRRVPFDRKRLVSLIVLVIFSLQIVVTYSIGTYSALHSSSNLDSNIRNQVSFDYTSVYRNETIELETSMYVSDDERILFDNCTIIATQDYCNIIITNGGFLRLENTTVKSIGDFEWYLVSHEGSMIELINCDFLAGYTTKELIHISGFDSLVQDCSFYNQPRGSVKVHDAQNVRLDHNNISGAEIGIEISYSSEVLVSNNSMRKNQDSIRIFDSSLIYIDANSVSETTSDGIFIDYSRDIEITRNVIDTTDDSTIYIRRTENITLSRNYLLSRIEFFDCTHCFIINNTIEYSASILIENAEDLTISSNSIYSSSGNGIDIFKTVTVNIVRNDIALAQGLGVSCERVDNICIFGNIINQTNEGAVSLLETSGRIFMNAFLQPFSTTITGSDLQQIDFCNAKYGNYYEDYQGTDMNGDTIGDDPYPIRPGILDLHPLMSVEQVVEQRYSINYTPPLSSISLELNQTMTKFQITASTNLSIEKMQLNYSIDDGMSWKIEYMTRNEIGWSTELAKEGFSCIWFNIILQDYDGNINRTSTMEYEILAENDSMIIQNPFSILLIAILLPIGLVFIVQKHKKPTSSSSNSQYITINLADIISGLTINRCWNFLQNILDQDKYYVIEFLFDEFVKDSSDEKAESMSNCGWRNRYQILVATGLSKRRIYGNNDVIGSLLRIKLLSKRESGCHWGRQKYHYRINTDHLLFQVMIDLT